MWSKPCNFTEMSMTNPIDTIEFNFKLCKYTMYMYWYWNAKNPQTNILLIWYVYVLWLLLPDYGAPKPMVLFILYINGKYDCDDVIRYWYTIHYVLYCGGRALNYMPLRISNYREWSISSVIIIKHKRFSLLFLLLAFLKNEKWATLWGPNAWISSRALIKRRDRPRYPFRVKRH